MARFRAAAYLAVPIALALCAPAAAQVQRTFVASYGSDANTASNCTFANPCRTFAAAQTVAANGGEIVALDGAGFAQITITKSISITANPGFFAGITAASGIAVNIATAGVKVGLRGLSINGVGTGTAGISMTAGSSLTIENCVIYGFAGSGIQVDAPGSKVRITNTTVRGNGTGAGTAGISMQAGDLDLSHSFVLDNFWVGVWSNPSSGNSSSVTATDTISSGNTWGFDALLGPGASSKMALIRVTASGNSQAGVQSEGGVISIGYSNISNNNYGLYNFSGTLETMNNNLVRGNAPGANVTSATGISGSGFSGPITNVGPQ